MHLAPAALLVLGAAAVGGVHAVLPDHWVPLSIVARAERWPMRRVTVVSSLAATGHVLASILLGGVLAVVGLRFRSQLEAQQGHLVGGLLILAGLGFLAWGVSGRGHPHAHDEPGDSHLHQHSAAEASATVHAHEHAHGARRHSHAHSHDAFVQRRSDEIAAHSRGGRLAALVVPFGVAASPDLSFLPLSVAAAAYGPASVVAVLVAFAAVTFLTFVGLTVGATAAGYQMRGEWLEDNAQTITALVLVAIGLVAFLGL